MKISTLEDLLRQDLKDLTSAENQLALALPGMIEAATDPALKAGLTQHAEIAEKHVENLRHLAELTGWQLSGHRCRAIEGLIDESMEMVEDDAGGRVRDAALMGMAQRIRYHGIAAYSTAKTLAFHLQRPDIGSLLQKMHDEEVVEGLKFCRLTENVIGGLPEQD